MKELFYLSDKFTEVNIEVTNVCNFDCWFCPRAAMSRSKGFMTLEQFKGLIDHLQEKDFIQEIAIAGIGEPTLHRDIIQMISYIKENTGFSAVLTTNASKFGDELFIEKLLDTGLDKLTISFRISDPIKNKSSLPSYLDHEGYINNLLNLIDKNQKLGIHTEIELSFFKETYYSRYILGLNSDNFINNKILNSFLQKLSRILDYELPSYDQCVSGFSSKLSNVDRIPVQKGLNFRFDSLSSWTTTAEKYYDDSLCYTSSYGSCLGMLTHFAIYWNGDVSTCCADFDVKNRLGNIFSEKDIIKILSSRKSIAYAQKLQKKQMPTRTCQICRGGKSRREKWANIIGTMLYLR